MASVEMPLFPLHTVLFPNMNLPLFIFERRYRLMMQRCLHKGIPFGVVLIREGQEVGGPALPCAVGTTARITEAERLEDGRLQVTAVGVQRFRILSTSSDRPYLTGVVEILPEAIGEPQPVECLLRQIRELYKAYLGMQQMLTRELVPITDLGLPIDAAHLSYHLAEQLNLPRREKQHLLELPDAQGRLEAEAVLLQREVTVLRWLVEQRQRGLGPPEFPNYIN